MVKCEQCGGEVKESATGYVGRFCSRACASKAGRKRETRFCERCEKPFEVVPSSKKRFCSHSCAAKTNNSGRGRVWDEVKTWTCLGCGNTIRSSRPRKFCNRDCQSVYQWAERKKEIEVNRFIPDTMRPSARRYLAETRGSLCEICGLAEWLGQPAPLILDHIDGDASNGALENLRLVCPNCDAQLPTYKGANKGNGRKYRRVKK